MSTAQKLPSSLSPHVCLVPSPDLVQLLDNASLPPLHDILQSFSPLPQGISPPSVPSTRTSTSPLVATRTTTLTTVSHPSFSVRFSDLTETEHACLDDDEERAARTIDWIGDRITKQCTHWLKELDDSQDRYHTPWWNELTRCAEGDHLPSKYDGWNHPVSIILAVSTTAPNPLQAITALHSRVLEFPSWVDTTHLLYTLIVHTKASPLSDEEATALFNAVKKQYGLHAFLLSLSLPSPPPPAVQVPVLPLRLPPPSSEPWQNGSPPFPHPPPSVVVSPNFLKLSEPDIQQLARFTREFVAMSLVPWMEKCVLEWNEAYTSSRRLPSRLFSSTRKFFGSNVPAQSPVHSSSTSVSSLSSRSHPHNPSQPASGTNVLTAPPSQLRRLAEFATVLGDYKLATSVWESLRKENKGGSDILPLLLSPSTAIPAHALYALSALHPFGSDMSPQAQMQALKYAVRWEAGISTDDFSADPLEGERWLVWAAGNAEEPPAALLLAHAALLSAKKNFKRRAALWYFFAASRLEKCGIKPLTMFFLRKAHELFSNQPLKLLSPSFWDSEGLPSSQLIGFDAVLPGIEHPLGRLLYTTGDIKDAVGFFLAQLRWSSVAKTDRMDGEGSKETNSDKVLLEDFRVAFSHLKSTSNQDVDFHDLNLPINFASPASSRARLSRDSTSGDQAEWEKREEIWTIFWRTRGKETLEKSGRAAVGEPFWVDIAFQNPLDTEVTLTDLTLVVEAKDQDPAWVDKYVTIERVGEVVLQPKEVRTLSIAVNVSRAASLTITGITYNFLDLFPTRESLARRGRRLQDTPQHRQNVTYAPDILIKIDVEEASQELAVSVEDDELLILTEGEHKPMKLRMTNAGCKTIGEIWLVGGPEDQMWLESATESESQLVATGCTETLHVDNKLSAWTPYAVPLDKELHSGDSTVVALTWYAGRVASQQPCLLFVYREAGGRAFHCTRVTRTCQVTPSLEISASFSPNPSIDRAFLVNLEVSNLSSRSMRINQVTAISPTWECHHLTPLSSSPLRSGQLTSISFSSSPLDSVACIEATTAFVSRTLCEVLNGRKIKPEDPPPLDLTCCHTSIGDSPISVHNPAVSHFLLSEKKRIVSNSIARSHPNIPPSTHPNIFPLFNSFSVDFLIFWEIPSEQRTGSVLLSGLNLGARHAALQETIESIERAKVKRSMYAETQREKTEILQSIRDSEWNAEMNPLVVTIQEGILEHDFSQGICLAPVKFVLRNHSLTHPSRYVVRFGANVEEKSEQSDLLPPRYVGRFTMRGVLYPSQSTTIETRLQVARPGTYALSGWQVETLVGEAGSSNDNQTSWRTRHRYVQGPPSGHRARLVVTDVVR